MPLESFVKLADPATYAPCEWDLCTDPAGRDYWVALFKRHVRMILDLGVACSTAAPGAPDRAARCADELHAVFDAFAARLSSPKSADPARHECVTILTLDAWRDGLLRKYGFEDAFADLKGRENAATLPLLPAVCRDLDALAGEEQLRAVIEGVFAGNIFDMGSEATAHQFLNGATIDFHKTREKLPKRPWRIDQYDPFAEKVLSRERSERAPYRKAVFFIDNAGSDFLLGALPMMRYLAQQGTHVICAANERPALNDMTIHDVRAWWPRILATEPSLRDLPITPVSTGTGEPLIDLGAVSPALNAASADADLVILEGMGRGVESNLNAQFNCDALNLAMLKDVAVAQRVGGHLYDVVCRFR
jgi:type II pantothenate kinase